MRAVAPVFLALYDKDTTTTGVCRKVFLPIDKTTAIVSSPVPTATWNPVLEAAKERLCGTPTAPITPYSTSASVFDFRRGRRALLTRAHCAAALLPQPLIAAALTTRLCAPLFAPAASWMRTATAL